MASDGAAKFRDTDVTIAAGSEMYGAIYLRIRPFVKNSAITTIEIIPIMAKITLYVKACFRQTN